MTSLTRRNFGLAALAAPAVLTTTTLPSLADDQGDGALLLKEFKSGQSLVGDFITQQPSDGWF